MSDEKKACLVSEEGIPQKIFLSKTDAEDYLKECSSTLSYSEVPIIGLTSELEEIKTDLEVLEYDLGVAINKVKENLARINKMMGA